MSAPLSLPPPPPGKSGWPWTELSTADPLDVDSPTTNWPRLTVVTPSFNQGAFLEETIRSVLGQGYPNLEYIICDGGSTDGSVDIIRRYEPWLTHWESESDRGQAHAINKGFARATGELVAWQNADDTYLPGALHAVGQTAREHPKVRIFHGDKDYVEADGSFRHTARSLDPSPENLVPWPCIFSEATFIRPAAHTPLQVDESYHHYMDFELFWRLALERAPARRVEGLRATFRQHADAKSTVQGALAQREAMRLYQDVFRRLPADSSARAKLRQAMRHECLNDWGSFRFELLRRNLRNSLAVAGWRVLSPKLLMVAALSLLPASWIRKLKGVGP